MATDVNALNQIVITGRDDSAAAFASAEQRLKHLGGTIGEIVGMFGSLEHAATAVFGLLGAGAFGAAVAGQIEYQASLAKTAAQTGATVESLSAMRTAAKYADTDMAAVAQTMTRFAAGVVAAQAGTGKQAEALKSLGFNAQTFATQFRSTDQAVLAVAKSLDEYGNGLGKTAILQALFGRSGADLAEFLHELAERGTDATKVTTAQAQAAKQLQDSIVKLKSSYTDLVSSLATTLVPILQKVVDSIDVFRNVALAAIAAFVAWPATVSAATAALGVYAAAAQVAAFNTKVLGVETETMSVLMNNSIIAIGGATTALNVMRTAVLGVFAIFAAWQLGKWWYDNFTTAKLITLSFVDSVLTGWEYIKYGAQGCWEFVKFALDQAVQSMRQSFGAFISWVAQGLSHVPGAGGAAAELSQFAAVIAGPSGKALDDFQARMGALYAQFNANKAQIHDITTDLMAYAIAADQGGAATDRASKKPPPVPKGAAQAVKDLTAALDAYLKSNAALEKAYADASAKAQLQAITNQQDDLKRQYDRGLVDFQHYWNERVALQKQAIGVEQQQIEAEVNAQQNLVTQLQANADKAQAALNGLTPDTKEYVAAQGALLKANTDLNNANAKLIGLQGNYNTVVEKGKQVGKDYVEQLTAEYTAILASNRSLEQQIAQQQLANETLALTASQIQLVIAAKVQARLQDEIEHNASQETIEALQKQIELRHQLAATLRQGEDQQAMLDMIHSVDQEAKQLWDDMWSGGHDTLKKLGDDIKKYLLDMLYQLTVRPFLINVAAQMTGLGQSTVAGALGQQGSNPLSALMNNGSSAFSAMPSGAAGQFFAGAAGSFATSGLGASLGLSSAVGGAAGIGADAIAGTSMAADMALTGTGLALTTAASFIPIAGLVIAGLMASGIFDSKPSETRGRFQISEGTTGFEDNAYTPTTFGLNLGFADADTQQFSGQAAQVFNQIVGGALDSFKTRFSTEQSDHFADILKTMTFDAFEGSYTTEDFIKKYGGQVLQQVVVAAFQELDPSLAAVAASFTGTADEVAKFSNSLLGIFDATKAIGNADFTKTIDDALVGADQAIADKVLAFVTIVQGLSPALDGLSQHMQAIDPANVTKFVDALGGAQQALQGMAFLNANFTTAADRAAQSQTTLTKAWTAAGITADDLARAGLSHIPQTHAEFLKLVNSIDLNTEHGRALAASLVDTVAPAFVAVQGSADAAAQALMQQAQAGRDLYTQHFLTPAEQTANRVSVDETALYNATKQGTLLNKVLTDMGLDVIPSTVASVRQWHDAVIAKYGADSDEAHAMEASIPYIYDLIDATGGFGDAAQQAANQIAQATGVIISDVGSIIQQAGDAAKTLLGQFSDLATESTGDFGEKLSTQIGLINSAIAHTDRSQFTSTTAYNVYLGTLRSSAAELTNELTRFTVLSAQYDAARAEQLVGLEQWDAQQKQLFKGNADALAALDVIFHEKWDAIVNGASAAAQSLDAFIQSIQQLAQKTNGNQGQQLALQLALSAAKEQALQTQYASLDPGSALAKATAADIAQLQANNEALAGEIAHFTIYSAQYGEAAANQLVTLELAYKQWQDAVGNNADALAVLNDIFNEQWQKIIDGTNAGVGGVQDAMQHIADYLKGLFVSEISPLTAREKLDAAKQALDAEIALAQQHDPKALGDVTQYLDTFLQLDREYKSGSLSFKQDFDYYTKTLGDIAGVQPNGQPRPDATTAISNALPTSGTIASNLDIKALADRIIAELQRTAAATADAHSDDAETIATAVTSTAQTLSNTFTRRRT